MEEIVTIGRRGEIVLSAQVREALGLKENDELVLSVEDAAVVLRRRRHGFGAYLETLTRRP